MANTTADLGIVITAQDDATKVFEELAATLNEVFAGAAESVKGLADEMQALSEGVAGDSTAMSDDIKVVSESITALSEETASSAGSMSEELSGVGTSAAEMASTVESEATTTSDSFAKVVESISGVTGALGGIQESASSGFANISEQLTGLQDSFKTTEESAKGVGETVNKMGSLASLQIMSSTFKQIGDNIVGFFTKSVESGAEFQQKIDAVTATLNSHFAPGVKLSTDQVQELTDKALQMGQTGYFSANQIADGMYTLARQGISYQDIMGGAMASIQNLAVATDSDLTDTSNVVSDIIHEMGGELSKEFGSNLQDQFTGVANMISGAMHGARMSMNDFLNSLKYVGPQAAQMGMSLGDASEAIALLAEHGIKGTQAGTTLRKMLQDLPGATKPARAELEQLGIITKNGSNEFFNANGTLKSFTDVQEILHEKLSKLNPEQQQFALKAIFGTTALSGMTIVANASASEMANLTQEIVSNSDAQALAKAKYDNLQGSMRQLNAEWQTTIKKIGEDLIPLYQQLVNVGARVLEFWNSLSPSTRQAIEYTTLFVGALALLVGTLAGIGVTVSFVIEGLTALGGILGNIAGGFSFAFNAVRVLATGFFNFSGIVTAAIAEGGSLAEILGLVVTALGGPVSILVALGVAFGVALISSKSFRDGVLGVCADVGKAFTAVKTFFFGSDLIADVTKASNSTVASIVKMTQESTTNILALKTNTDSISKDMANSLISTSNDIKTKCVAAADDRLKKETDDATYLAANIKGLSEQQKQTMIDNANKQHDASIASATDLNKKVTDEITKLQQSGVKITDQMRADIIQKFQAQRDGAISACSDTKIQAETIMNELKANSSTISAQQASDTLQKAYSQRDGQIKAADDTYNQTVQKITEMKDKYGTINQQQADAMISQARRQHDGAVNEATQMSDQVVSTVKKMAGSNIEQVDTSTGKMKTGWQNFCDGVKSTVTKWRGDDQKGWDDYWKSTNQNSQASMADSQKYTDQWLNSMGKNFNNTWNNLKSTVSGWRSNEQQGWNSYWQTTNQNATASMNSNEQSARAWLNSVGSNISSGMSNMYQSVTNGLNSISSSWNNTWNGISSWFRGALSGITNINFGQFLNMGQNIINNIANGIRSAHIPTPHFSMSGSLNPADLLQGKFPSIGVQFYADGGIMMNPTAFGMNGGNAMVGGEAGPEAILPISKLPELMHQYDREYSNVSRSRGAQHQVNNITITVNGVGKNGKQLGNDIATQLRLQMPMVSV